MKKEIGYEVQYEESKIVLSKTFVEKAGIYDSEEYRILKGLRADFPEYEILIRKIKSNTKKRTYSKLKTFNILMRPCTK